MFQTMEQAITINFFHFKTRLSEWVSDALIHRYQAEIFGQYCIGRSIPEVAQFIEAIELGRGRPIS